MPKKRPSSQRKKHLPKSRSGMYMNLKAVPNWPKKAKNVITIVLPGLRVKPFL